MPARVPLRLSALASLLSVGSRHAWFVENEVSGLAELVGPGSVVFDVGAEYGLYTWSLAALVGPAGAVHAVLASGRPGTVWPVQPVWAK